MNATKIEQLRTDMLAISAARGVRVLIVDDDLDSRLLIRDMLTPYKLSVGEADNGDHALEALALTKYDVVLLDVKMPEMNGLVAHHEIKKRWPDVRVIICTGHMDFPGLQHALQDGVVQIISKQFLEKSLAEIFAPLCTKKTS